MRKWIATSIGLALLVGGTVQGQTSKDVYPNRPVRMIVPFGAGGPGDIFARLIGQKLSEQLGQQFVIEKQMFFPFTSETGRPIYSTRSIILEHGQTVSGVRSSASLLTRSGSASQRTPWSMRSTWSVSRASLTYSAPPSSPA